MTIEPKPDLISTIRSRHAHIGLRIEEGRVLKGKDIVAWVEHAVETMRLHDELDALIDQLPEPEFAILYPKMAWRFQSLLLSV